MSTHSPTLTWELIQQLQSPLPSPVIVAGRLGRARNRILARLGAEVASKVLGGGGSILWVGAQHVSRPLAWLPLEEQWLDARRPNPRLGGGAWPGVNPFDLNPELAAAFLGLASGMSDRESTDALSLAIRALISEAGSPPIFTDGLSRLAHSSPMLARLIESARWAGRSTYGSANREISTLSFRDGGITVIAGHTSDLVGREGEVLLATLRYISEPPRGGETRLVVIEDWLDSLLPPAREIVLAALLSYARHPGAFVVLASANPGRWAETTHGVAALGAAGAIVGHDFQGEWPASWRGVAAEHHADSPDESSADADMEPVAVRGFEEGGAEVWHEVAVPHPLHGGDTGPKEVGRAGGGSDLTPGARGDA